MTAALEPTLDRYANLWLRHVTATRPAFLTATLAACLLGLATAHHDGVATRPVLVVVTLLLALLVHAAVNVLNDYYDALGGTDALNEERLFPFTGGSRFIQNGVMTPLETARFGYGLLLCAMAGGLWLVTQVGVRLVAIGAVGLFIGWAYSATPLKLNSRGLGELCVLLGFLGIVVGADFVQRGDWSLSPVLTGLPYALLATNLLFINQFPDRKADAATGKHHWVVRLSWQAAARLYGLISLLSLSLLLTQVWLGWLPFAALAAALPWVLSLRAAMLLARHAEQPAQLGPAIRLTIAAMLAHGILLAVSLW